LSGWFDDTPQRRVEFSFGFRSCAIGRREAWGFDMGRSEFMGGIHDLDIGIGGTVYLFRHLPLAAFETSKGKTHILSIRS
jgi:hypothetical protein